MASNTPFSNYQDISIAEFLARLGYYPVKKSGKELFYHSMLRVTAGHTPSLSVWDQGGKWIDRGGANHSGIYGGGIIQLAQAYWTELSLNEVLKKIDQTLNIVHYEPIKPIYLKDDAAHNEHSYAFKLIKTEPLGTNHKLTDYLKSRGVLDAAQGRMQEIYYINQNNKRSKTYFGLGWKNEHRNWEFSTPWGFKSSIGQKGISIIPGSVDTHVVIFEGYMDYLTWLKLNPADNHRPSVFVLNSISHLKKVLDKIESMQHIELFLDNDNPGKQAVQVILDKYPHAIDKSYLYEGYKDYNEMLMDESTNRKYGNKR